MRNIQAIKELILNYLKDEPLNASAQSLLNKWAAASADHQTFLDNLQDNFWIAENLALRRNCGICTKGKP